MDPSETGRRRLRRAIAGAANSYLVTLPALMQDVQTFRRLGLPATVARTR